MLATNSIAMPGIELGERALVGAMLPVTRDVAPLRVVVGSPAHNAGAVEDVSGRDVHLDPVQPWSLKLHSG